MWGRALSPGHVAGAALAALAHGGLFAAAFLLGPSGTFGAPANDTFTVTLVDAPEVFQEPEPEPVAEPLPVPEPSPPPPAAPQPVVPKAAPAPVATDPAVAEPARLTAASDAAETPPPPAAPTPADGAADTIEAPASAAPVPMATAQAAALPGDGRDNLQAFMREVRLHLARHAPRGVAGARTCKVEFHLSRTGEVVFVKLRGSSGKPLYDRRCLQSVTSAAPFPEAPAGTSAAELSFTIEMKQKRRQPTG